MTDPTIASWSRESDLLFQLRQLREENERLRTALEQPEQPEQQAEPVACRFCHSKKGCWTWQCYHCGEIDDVQQPALPLPVQPEPLEYWNAVEGWVKIDEVREHFDAVGCGTIYKTAGEDRVPLYTAPPQQQAEPPPEWPLIKNILAVFGLDAISFVAKWQAAQQQAEQIGWAVQGCSKMWRGEFAEIDAKAEAKRIGGTCVAFALYTEPPQRSWVGLTEEEIEAIGDKVANERLVGLVSNFRVRLSRAIEAKLKERNCE